MLEAAGIVYGTSIRVLCVIKQLPTPPAREVGKGLRRVCLRMILPFNHACASFSCVFLAVEHRGFYDRKKLFWKDVEDTTLCAACAPPGGGRQEITPRFVRHFTMLCVPPPSDAATKTILSAIFNGFLSDFPRDMAGVAAPIINCSVEAYNRYGDLKPCFL